MSKQFDLDYFDRLEPRLPSAAGTNQDQIGTLTHELISAIAAACGGGPSTEQVRRVVAGFDFGAYSAPTVRVRRQRSATLAAVFFRRFSRPAWTLVGSEQIVDDVAFDLLWQQEGCIEADEIKTGSSASGVSLEEARVQAQGQAQVGREEFGQSFGGVRLVLLKAPARSEFFSPNGGG